MDSPLAAALFAGLAVILLAALAHRRFRGSTDEPFDSGLD
jgi:hypothetical protein